MLAPQGPVSPAPASPKRPTRVTGSRRIFPALFKLQVLDAYRLDHECKGNQRATARKFNVHRRQIQKWLQCETSLRASVADALRYDAGQAVPSSPAGAQEPRLDADPRLQDPGSRVYKHDARTLKLVAQKLYPSFNMHHGEKGEMTHTAAVQCFVPKEYQLNDTRHEPSYKLSMTRPAPHLILKESGLKMCGSETNLYRNVARPQPVLNASPFADEPYNLAMSPALTSQRPATPVVEVTAAATSPLPARVAEIVADSKTSAFSPKRKWLQYSMQEQVEPLPLVKKASETSEPPAKKPCPDFSIARLCGSPATQDVKTEVLTPPPMTSRYPASLRYPSPAATVASCYPTPPSTATSSYPTPPATVTSDYPTPPASSSYPTPLVFPPPLLMLHRSIPELKTLHFKPDPSPFVKEEVRCKEESFSDEEDDIDVTSTSPSEDKSFEFPMGFHNGKRRSFSVQFKLNVLDAFYNDKDCNQNQRATARKFNINRRQVQKWLSLEEDLRCEGRSPPCAQCPHHCAPLTPQHWECAYPQVPWMMPAAIY